MSVAPASTDIVDVTCPFCGLVCDDLAVRVAGDGITVRANGCHVAAAGFGRPAGNPSPRVGGRTATLPQAAAAVAKLLQAARQPLVAGLGTDVAGARAAGRLADRCGAILDHMNSTAALRNLLVLQDGGWITTTLSEIRNRCDLLIAAGSDLVTRFPRFFERTIANNETLFTGDRRCEVIFLGRGPVQPLELPGPVRVFPCDLARLSEAFGLLRAILADRPLQATEAAGVPLAAWRELADRMRQAHYGVVAWAAADFDFPHAELTLQALCELIKDLNRDGRFAGMPLGGSDGDLTADSVHLWQTGYGGRTSYGQGQPDHDPYLYSTARMLQGGGADALLWISSFSETRGPPATTVPTVVLGRSGMALEREPEVYIPVGTPGVDHGGTLFRADRVVALPVQQLRSSTLPSVADAIAAIEAAL
jgi:formylmethanofuran dehydrogenase subunit B